MTRRTKAIVGVAALIALAVGGFLVFRVVQFVQYMRSEGSVRRPGEAEFRAANARIHVNRGTKAFGNTPEAVELARAYSESHQALRQSFFEGGRRSALAAAKGEFLVYCQLRQDACVFLVHVPELRQYTGEAKDALRTLSWRAAQSVLASPPSGDRELLVALRGAVLFESILTGRSQGEPTVYTEGMRELRRLYPYFQPRRMAADAKANPATNPVPRASSEVAPALASVLPGKWTNAYRGLETEVLFEGDGTFEGSCSKAGAVVWSFSGTWAVSQGRLEWRYLESSLPLPSDRQYEADPIQTVEASRFSLLEKDGSTTVWTRVAP